MKKRLQKNIIYLFYSFIFFEVKRKICGNGNLQMYYVWCLWVVDFFLGYFVQNVIKFYIFVSNLRRYFFCGIIRGKVIRNVWQKV